MMVIPKHPPLRRAVIFFVLAFLITWIVWVPRAINLGGFFDSGFGEVLGMVWSYGPALAAIVAALVTAGRPGLRELGGRLATWRVGWIWYLVAIVGPLVLVGLVGLVDLGLGGSFGDAWTDGFDNVFALLPVFLVLCLTDGLGEETGWRGFALPRLLEVTGAVVASILLGVVWAAWHLPLFWTEGAPLFESSILILFLRLPATSIMFTWLYQRTRGSLLLAIFFHAALNLFAAAPSPDSNRLAWIGVGVHWAVALLLIPQVRRQHARSQIITASPQATPSV